MYGNGVRRGTVKQQKLYGKRFVRGNIEQQKVVGTELKGELLKSRNFMGIDL